MNTQENNKLIAEFMGLELTTDGISDLYYTKDKRLKQIENYHTSWDWLMPVVSKCREESNAEDSHWEAIYYSLEGCDIDVTHYAVVEFINQ